MIRRIFIVLAMVLLAVVTGCDRTVRPDAATARPVQAPVHKDVTVDGKLTMGTDEKTVILSTSDGFKLPPVAVGTNFKLYPSVGPKASKEVNASNYKDYAGSDVIIYFSGEGAGRVVDYAVLKKDR
jgi:hypothetical protein